MDPKKKPVLKTTIRNQLNQCIDEPFIKVQKNMEELRDTLQEIKRFMTSDFDKNSNNKVKRDHWDQMI